MPAKQLAPRLYSWASILADNTLEQALKTASMPIIDPHMALMPDAHLGKGATVGSVIPTREAVMPAAVGVDIGCGMEAVRTQFTGERLRSAHGPLSRLRRAIEGSIPLSAGNDNTRLTASAAERVEVLEKLAEQHEFEPDVYARNWRLQLGSLGSGNHFIEVTRDQEDRVWLFLHSGSRGVGNKIAMHHIKVAQDWCARHRIDLPDRDLAYLVEDSEEFWTYIRQLRWAQEFARLNRAEMMDRLRRCVEEFTGEDIEPDHEVSCHHNYTERERHDGREVWLTRKGAIDASAGRWGLIPGSMGTRSYVVVGKGNPLSLNSAPHGAGREYSRSAASRVFTMDQLVARMEGIEWSRRPAFLDEIPDAYKPIDVIMEDAADLVEVRYELSQIVNVKGD
jgi:tRNA-splicing ligase RtcB